MLLASKTTNNSGGYTIWDIFGPHDKDTINEFIKEQNLGPHKAGLASNDQVLSTQYYLGTDQLQMLSGEGVTVTRIHQLPGEIVLIPGGCPYQVWTLRVYLYTQVSISSF